MPEQSQARSNASRPKLGAGDSAYIMAWCAWRAAEIRTSADWNEDDARQRFTQWWNEIGNCQLEEYGYRLLDTEGCRSDSPMENLAG